MPGPLVGQHDGDKVTDYLSPSLTHLGDEVLVYDPQLRPVRPDPDFEEATEGEEVDRKEKLKTKWAQLEAIVGAEKRQ
jgi:hypothetical protein